MQRQNSLLRVRHELKVLRLQLLQPCDLRRGPRDYVLREPRRLVLAQAPRHEAPVPEHEHLALPSALLVRPARHPPRVVQQPRVLWERTTEVRHQVALCGSVRENGVDVAPRRGRVGPDGERRGRCPTESGGSFGLRLGSVIGG